MNISFVRHSLLNRGGDKMVLSHAAYLAEKGHEVTIVTNRINTVFPIDPKIKILSMPIKSKFGTLLFCLLKRQPASVLIADIIPVACFLMVRNGSRVVYFAQDYDESYYRNKLLKLFIRCLYFFTLALMKVPTIAVSDALTEQLSKHYHASAYTVLNGVDATTFYPEPSPVLMQSKGDRKAVLILSRKDRRKGFDLARSIVAKLAHLYTAPFEVWTVGEPAAGMFPEICHRDFGYINEANLRAFFSSADVFLYPSRHEGYPLMVIEAFACRCPVVTTKAVPYAKQGENALVSEVEDADSLAHNICNLLQDDLLKQNIVKQAFLHASSNTMQKSHCLFERSLLDIYSRQTTGTDAKSIF